MDASRGKFWQGGDSFLSDHAVTAWAAAIVISHEYPGLLTKILVYGAASAISITRVEGKKHFPADAFVGSGVGWLSGWQVYRAHHNSELGGGIVDNLSASPDVPTDHTPSAMGSPYVPLDSWIYPLLERLAAQGLFDEAILGMKPWTRLECAVCQRSRRPLEGRRSRENVRTLQALRYSPRGIFLGTCSPRRRKQQFGSS